MWTNSQHCSRMCIDCTQLIHFSFLIFLAVALLSGTLRTFQKTTCDSERVALSCPRGTSISIELAQYEKNGIGMYDVFFFTYQIEYTQRIEGVFFATTTKRKKWKKKRKWCNCNCKPTLPASILYQETNK